MEGVVDSLARVCHHLHHRDVHLARALRRDVHVQHGAAADRDEVRVEDAAGVGVADPGAPGDVVRAPVQVTLHIKQYYRTTRK